MRQVRTTSTTTISLLAIIIVAFLIYTTNGFTILPQQRVIPTTYTIPTITTKFTSATSTTASKKARASTRNNVASSTPSKSTSQYMLPPDMIVESSSFLSDFASSASLWLPSLSSSSSILTAVDVFDGSSIVDPVVVSDVFWTSLKAKIIAVIIGQALAGIAFAIFSSFLASQISQMGDFVSKQIFKSSSPSPSPTSNDRNQQREFIKASQQQQQQQQGVTTVNADFGKLLLCLAVDIIGSSSELIPVLGEFTDVIYAPIAATILRSIYGGSNVIFALEFAEEILPFTDILPLATIWYVWVLCVCVCVCVLHLCLNLCVLTKRCFVL